MLIKTTNRCSLGCTHCMENSRPTSPHMELSTFRVALAFTKDIEALAHAAGYTLVMLSGGECTEHPEIVEMIRMVYAEGLMPMLITNGMWLYDEDLKTKILDSFPKLLIQVTNDPRFYPSAPPRVEDSRIVYVDSLTQMIPLGRFGGKTHDELPNKTAPSSFNFRSIVRGYDGDVRRAIAHLRMSALMGGRSGHCAPSISQDGSFVAGETRLCHKLGTVWEPVEVIARKVLEMGSCNRCGLEDNLDDRHRAAIGI